MLSLRVLLPSSTLDLNKSKGHKLRVPGISGSCSRPAPAMSLPMGVKINRAKKICPSEPSPPFSIPFLVLRHENFLLKRVKSVFSADMASSLGPLSRLWVLSYHWGGPHGIRGVFFGYMNGAWPCRLCPYLDPANVRQGPPPPSYTINLLTKCSRYKIISSSKSSLTFSAFLTLCRR